MHFLQFSCKSQGGITSYDQTINKVTVLYGKNTRFLTRFWRFDIFLGRILGDFWRILGVIFGGFLEAFLIVFNTVLEVF